MRTSDTFRSTRGFTLMELVVVMALLAMVTMLAMPNLQTLYQTVAFSGEREKIIMQINELGAKAYRRGAGYRLHSENGHLDLPRDIPFEMSEEWSINVVKHIRYLSNGACLGGELNLTRNDEGTEKFILRHPHCQIFDE